MYFCKNTGVNQDGSCQCRKRTDGIARHDVGCYFDKRCRGNTPCGEDATSQTDTDSEWEEWPDDEKESSGEWEKWPDDEKESSDEWEKWSDDEIVEDKKNIDTESCCPKVDEVEKQDNHMCGKHAINNIFGHEIVTSRILDQAAREERNKQIRRLVDQGAASKNEAEGFISHGEYGASPRGDYHIFTLLNALDKVSEIYKYGLNLEIVLASGKIKDGKESAAETLFNRINARDRGLVGIVARTKRSGGHYVAIKPCHIWV